MSKSRTISLRPKAIADLEDIFKYSVPEFGIARAEQYIRGLNEAFISLAEEPHVANVYGHIKPKLMGFPVVSHIIFFRYTSTQLLIIRVLHKSMDYIRHL
jgi:toxin ParE1/3/4